MGKDALPAGKAPTAAAPNPSAGTFALAMRALHGLKQEAKLPPQGAVEAASALPSSSISITIEYSLTQKG